MKIPISVKAVENLLNVSRNFAKKTGGQFATASPLRSDTVGYLFSSMDGDSSVRTASVASGNGYTKESAALEPLQYIYIDRTKGYKRTRGSCIPKFPKNSFPDTWRYKN